MKYIGAMGTAFSLSPIVTGLASGIDRVRDLETKSQKVERLTFLQTTDIHGQVMTHPEFFMEDGQMVFKKAGGMSRIASYFKKVKQENPGSVFSVDCGDCYQGSALATLSEGKALVPIMNKVGYDLALPGNWEVFYGPQNMVNLMESYTFPVLCSNMHWGENYDDKSSIIFPPYYIKQMGGVRVGFIGYNDPKTKKRQAPSYHEGIGFSQPEKTIPLLVNKLKFELKCDLVIMLAHLGLAQQVNLAKLEECAGVDFILGGDTHERTYEPIFTENQKVPVVEAGAFGSFVGRLDLVLEDKKIKDYSYKLEVIEEDLYKEDQDVKTTVHRVRKPYKSEIDRVIGKTESYLYRYSVLETPMDNMITDAIREQTGVDIGISNGFRFCPPIEPGEITIDHLYSMLPSNNSLKTGKVTGKQIKDWLEQELENVFSEDITKRVGGWVVRFSGMKITIHVDSTKGQRVESIEIGEKRLDLNQNYSISACVKEGDPDHIFCRIPNVTDIKILNVTNYDAVENFLSKHSPVNYEIEGRVTALDRKGIVLSQLPGTDYVFR
ncbi:bifunctional metallophosphatase/5'-nucleotidase [Bacillus sp. SCS-153A]|uniref:bifunctional metallophosphatase/5'-nucleotidase n=1 Tax=Rossellomorea sedimentorum TaxID=3115294 RepID=UPI003905ADE4